MFSFWTKLSLIRSIELPLSTINRKSRSLPSICKRSQTSVCVTQVVVEAAAAAARSFSHAGALHWVASKILVLELREGPSTPLSRCFFPTVFLGLPVPLVLLLRLFFLLTAFLRAVNPTMAFLATPKTKVIVLVSFQVLGA